MFFFFFFPIGFLCVLNDFLTFFYGFLWFFRLVFPFFLPPPRLLPRALSAALRFAGFAAARLADGAASAEGEGERLQHAELVLPG